MDDKTLKKLEKLSVMFDGEGEYLKVDLFIETLKRFSENIKSDLENNSKYTEKIDFEMKSLVNQIYTDLKSIKNDYSSKIENTGSSINEKINSVQAKVSSITTQINSLLQKVDEIASIEVQDGKDADEEKMKSEIFTKLLKAIDENKEVLTGEDIVDRINLLDDSEDNKIDAKYIKNLPVFHKGTAGITSIRMASDVRADNPQNGQSLQWDSASQMFILVQNASTDEKVKVDASGTAGYLFDKLTAGTNVSLAKVGDTVRITALNELPNFTTGQILFGDGDNVPSTDSGLFWDNVNKRLGIGTSSPSANLEVNGTTAGYLGGIGNIRITNSADTTKRFLFGIDTTLGTFGGAFIQAEKSGTANLPLYIQPGGGVTTIAGNLGIGTTLPLSELDVRGSVYINHGADRTMTFVRSGANTFTFEHDASRFYIYNATTAVYPLAITNAGSIGFGTVYPSARVGIVGAGATSATNSLVVHNSTGSSNSLVVKDDGKVGIGIENPSFDLHVNGTLSSGNASVTNAVSVPILALNNATGTNNAYIVFQNNAATKWTVGMGVAAVADQYQVYSNTLGAPVMTYTSIGNVGIGTASPNSTGHINGSIATAYVEKTANYTATISDSTINCTANTFTVTIPTAVGISGRIYNIKNSGTGTITIATTSSQTIDGATTQTLSTQYASYTVQSTGTNWIII